MLYPVLVFAVMAAWGIFHSWLAAISTKRLARRIFGVKIDRYYRLIFISVAILTFTPILALVAFLPSNLLWVIPMPWCIFTIAIQFIVVIGILVTIFQTDWLAFVGLKQLKDPDAESNAKFVQVGMYKVVRHPMYLFSFVLFWLFPYVTDLVLSLMVASTLYFLIGMIPEERKLVEIFGEDYTRYQEDVPPIFPGLKF